MAHGLADDAHGDVSLFGSRSPRMARHIHGEGRGYAGKGANLLEVAVDAEHGVEILGALGAVFARDDGQEILRGRGTVGVDDGLHGAFPSDGELLARLLAAVDDVAVAQVFFAEIGDVDKRHAAHIEREEKDVAGEGERLVAGEIESLDAAYGGHADGTVRGLVDTRVDGGEGFTLGSDALGNGLVVDAAQDAHIKGCGVAAQAARAEPRLVGFGEGGINHAEV